MISDASLHVTFIDFVHVQLSAFGDLDLYNLLQHGRVL